MFKKIVKAIKKRFLQEKIDELCYLIDYAEQSLDYYTNCGYMGPKLRHEIIGQLALDRQELISTQNELSKLTQGG